MYINKHFKYILQTKSTVSLTNESAFVLKENGKLRIKPYIEELPELFVRYFKEILRVGYNIPRLEYYMSKGKQFLRTSGIE